MSNNDTVIRDLLTKVEEQKKGLGTKPKGAWITNGVFQTLGGFNIHNDKSFFNINTVSDSSVFAIALGLLIGWEEAFDKACGRLGVKADFEYNGYSVEEWESDFKLRISMIEYDKKKKTLDATKKKLTSLVSEEERTAMELEEITKALE